MSERTFHADLSSSEFPYNFRELSSTVVFNQGSEIQRGVPGGLGGTEAVKNFGMPQAYYLDNVLPITRGYSTVGFSSVVPSAEITGDIVASFNVLGKSDNIALFVATRTSVHVYDPNGGQWRQFSIGAAEADRISYAYIKEVTYIYYGYNVYIYNFDSQELELQELKGIDAAALQGITAAGAYLIAWDATTIYRSSVLDPLDFDPTNGLSTGAGSTGVLAVKGRILTCLTLGQDFVIYTKNNAISARQTGQIQFPFIFDEIPGSAGILSVAHVAYNSNQGTHVTWTASGFQEVTLGGAQYIWPELSDGITRGITVNTDVVFGIPDFQRVIGLQVSLSFASNRWIVVSTGTESSVRSEAYVYDTVLGRWGRLKVPHVAFFEFLIPEVFFSYTYEQFGIDYPFYSSIPESMVYAQLTSDNQITVQGVGNNLGMLLPDGSVYTVSWSETGEFRGQSEVIGAAKSRIILGKFKPFRTRGMIHQSLKVTRLFDASLKLYGHDYTGKFIAVKEDLVQNQKHKGQWFGRLNADSVSIGIEGKFLLTDLSFVATDSGKINQRYTELSTVLVATTEIYPLEEPQPDCCAFTGPRMIYELVFQNSFGEMRINFDVQECNELCFYTVRPQGNSTPDGAEPVYLGDFYNYAYYTSTVTLDPPHRPEVGHNIILFTAQNSTYKSRYPAGMLTINPTGEVLFQKYDQADVLATEGMMEYLPGGYYNPPGAYAFSGVYRRAV